MSAPEGYPRQDDTLASPQADAADHPEPLREDEPGPVVTGGHERPADPPGPVIAGDPDRRDEAVQPGDADLDDRDDTFVSDVPGQDGRDEAVQPGDADLGDRALVDSGAAQTYRARWGDVQASFVDEPRDAVAQAHGLVAEVVQEIVDRFGRERDSLESTWSSGDEVSTEDLRLALRRYRTFFDRLLTT